MLPPINGSAMKLKIMAVLERVEEEDYKLTKSLKVK